jgi:hypothetical protein
MIILYLRRLVITNCAFRNTTSYDLNSLSGPSTSPLPRNKLFGDSEPALEPLLAIEIAKTQLILTFDFIRMLSRRTSYRFPLLGLPAELRIMIANYALRVPNGLKWVWKNFAKAREPLL